MTTIRFKVLDDCSLQEIEDLLSFRESSRHCEFLDSKVAYLEGGVVNLVTFELYDDVSVPKALVLRKKGDAPPAAATKFWEGVFVAKGQLVVTLAYRAQ